MADSHRRRRVKSNDSEGSFSESDGEVEDANEPENITKESHQKSERAKLKEPEVLSEIVDEEGGEEGIAETEYVEGGFLSGDDNYISEDEDYADEDYGDEEREEGDGEECSSSNTTTTGKELDFDEDRRNPQYIPKKGIFYEHDDRNNEDEKETGEEPARDRKKKLWLDEGKWGHDRFREEEQYPKSRQELIDTYGYDIRNEEGPPRARRWRRYGSGPTKYDRSWEDVTAYNREKFKGSPDGSSRGRRGVGRFRGASRFRGRGRRHFSEDSARNENEDSSNNKEEVSIKTETEVAEFIDDTPIINTIEFPALPSKELEPEVENVPDQDFVNNKNSPNVTDVKSVRTLTFENSNYGSWNSVKRDTFPKRGKTPPFAGNNNRRPRRPNLRGSRGSGRGDYNKQRGNLQHISPRFLENGINNICNDMQQLSIDVSPEACNGFGSEDVHQVESNSVLPRNSNGIDLSNVGLKGGGDSSGRPKRYSSLRQRSLPETNTYQNPPPQSVQQPHPSYYDTGYQTTIYAPTETCVPAPSTQSQTVTSTPIMNPTAYQTFTPPSYTDSYGLHMPPVTPSPQLFPQVSMPAPQPLMAPQSIITPTPNIMSFAPPPPHAGYQQFALNTNSTNGMQHQQYGYQQYTTPPPPPPPAPPADMFQTGITYYYPQSQPAPVQPTVQRRPKVAIPILPPPE